eukprot:gene2298-biopygen1305
MLGDSVVWGSCVELRPTTSPHHHCHLTPHISHLEWVLVLPILIWTAMDVWAANRHLETCPAPHITRLLPTQHPQNHASSPPCGHITYGLNGLEDILL